MLGLFIFLPLKKHRNGRTNKMQLIEEIEGGFSTWFWKNQRGEIVSPRYPSKEAAEKWYNLHNNWLESPAIIR